jgi:hypothetical protein
MSHHSTFALSLIPLDKIDDFISSKKSTLIGFQSLHGTTRSDHFKQMCKSVLGNLDQINNIRFLSEESFERRECVTGINDDSIYRPARPDEWSLSGDMQFGNVLEYTVIHPHEIESVLGSINRLIEYSLNNLDNLELSDYLASDKETLLANIHYHENVNDCFMGEEGDTTEFYFAGLHSIATILEEAIKRNLVAIYVNDQYGPIVKE